MKKRLMMVAVLLGALTLGACVDDNESQSVTDVRNAKAEQLKSIAAMNNAEAQAKLVYANAEAKLKEAEAALKQAQADKEAAEAKIKDLEAKLAADSYNAKLTAELAKAEQEKAAADAAIASIKGEAEKYQLQLQARIAELQKDLLIAQGKLTDQQDETASAEMRRLEKLAKNYGTLLYSYTEEQNNLANLKTKKLKMETNLGTWKANKETEIAANKVTIELIDQQIAYYKKYENYTEDLTALQNERTLKAAERDQAVDKSNALNADFQKKWNALEEDKGLEEKFNAILENELVTLHGNYTEDYVYNNSYVDENGNWVDVTPDPNTPSIYFVNYCPIVRWEPLDGDNKEEKIVKGDYECFIKSVALELEAKDLRLLKLDVDKAIADLDIKGLTEAINKAETGTKALLDKATKAAVAAEAAYKADATKEAEYRKAIDEQDLAQDAYDGSVEALETANANKTKLENGYALVSSSTAALEKLVTDYNAAVRTAYTPVAEVLFAANDAGKTVADLNAQLSSIDAVLTGNGEEEMPLNQWLMQQYGQWFTGDVDFEYGVWVDDVNGGHYEYYWQNVYLNLWNASIKTNVGQLNGAERINWLISELEKQKVSLEKDNADYSHVTNKEQAIALKDAEIKNLEAVISVIEAHMNKAKATLDAAMAAVK